MAFIMAWGGAEGGEAAARACLEGFRGEVYWSFWCRRDALFELCDAVACSPGRVTDLARLSLEPEFRRGHGALYDALGAGRAGFARLRRALAGLPLPAWPDGRVRLAVDVPDWLRPEAGTSPARLFCHVHGRGRNAGQAVPGWPYSVVAALGPGRSSWALPLDAVRLGPDDDDLAVTAGQLRDVVTRLIAAGQWQDGAPRVVIAMDAGYNVTRLAWLLADLPVVLVARVRSDRVFFRPAPPRVPGRAGRTAVHGAPVRCADPAARPDPDLWQEDHAAGRGPGAVTAWNRVHQALHRHCGGWQDWPARTPFPVVAGTLIRLECRQPGTTQPMWLWASAPAAGPGEVRVLWTCYLRRFDLEHMFRFLKQQLGWTRPLLRDPAAADRWTWLVIAAVAQLWLARTLASLARLPWQPRRPPGGDMTPGQVRAGFRRVRQTLRTPASAAKPGAPGPGRPKGSKNKHKAPRHPVGKTHPKPSSRHARPAKKAKRTG